MIGFLIYLLKVAVITSVFFLFYKISLSKLTFHGFDRTMLLLIVVLSFILPLCNVGTGRLVNIVRNAIHIENIAVLNPQVPQATELTGLSAMEDGEPGPVDAEIDFLHTAAIILFLIWGIGFIYLSVRKASTLVSIRRVINDGHYQDRIDECDFIENSGLSQPMNWMNYILMPKEWLEKENQAVYKHEMLHAKKLHSLDFLLVDIMQLFQWFNPVMVLINKELELIHEYQADRAVLESGADAYQYKLMLVQAVAGNHGYAMTNWLRQTNLKKRIDMMQRNESNGWTRLRALFIPLLATMFAVLNTAMAMAQDRNFHWEPFQDGRTWVYPDGTAKVQTADGVQASMKVTDVAKYLSNYKAVKTTRMTLRYMYNVDDLNVAYPLSRSLADKGIHVSIANNDDMLTEMTMPEYRTPAIYDLGNGQFRFEVNCNLKRNVHTKILYGQEFNNEQFSSVVNPSVTGTLDEVMKWIDLFDGHGLAIYPNTMTTSQVDKIAQAVWKRGLDQVSIVDDQVLPGKYRLTTIIPKKYSFKKEFGNINALEAARKKHQRQTTDYAGKGIHIRDPKFFYSNNNQVVTDVINAPDELILVLRVSQHSYQWVKAMNGCEIEVDSVRYKQTRSEGMEGFEQTYFWSPNFGHFYQTLHFPPVPADAKMLNLYSDNLNEFIKQLQITADDDIYEKVKTIRYDGPNYTLKTTHVNDDTKDQFSIERVDFTDKETVIYCHLYVRAAHSFPGYVSSDFSLTLGNGQTVKPLRIEGVPLDQDYDRHGDWVANYIQVILPAISYDDWKNEMPVLHGSVLHEPFDLEINNEYRIPELSYQPLKELKYDKCQLISVVTKNMLRKYAAGEAEYLNLPPVISVTRKGADYLIKGVGNDESGNNEYTLRFTGRTVQIVLESEEEVSAAEIEFVSGNGNVLTASGVSIYEDGELVVIYIRISEDTVLLLYQITEHASIP